jgi:hypothetical protein
MRTQPVQEFVETMGEAMEGGSRHPSFSLNIKVKVYSSGQVQII